MVNGMAPFLAVKVGSGLRSTSFPNKRHANRVRNEPRYVSYAELVHEIRSMVLDSCDANVQFGRDLLARESVCDQYNYFPLPCC